MDVFCTVMKPDCLTVCNGTCSTSDGCPNGTHIDQDCGCSDGSSPCCVPDEG